MLLKYCNQSEKQNIKFYHTEVKSENKITVCKEKNVQRVVFLKRYGIIMVEASFILFQVSFKIDVSRNHLTMGIVLLQSLGSSCIVEGLNFLGVQNTPGSGVTQNVTKVSCGKVVTQIFTSLLKQKYLGLGKSTIKYKETLNQNNLQSRLPLNNDGRHLDELHRAPAVLERLSQVQNLASHHTHLPLKQVPVKPLILLQNP